jgi:hypothetical protein
MSQEPPPAVTGESVSSFENFLRNWIDNDYLDRAIGIAKNHQWTVSWAAWFKSIPSLPEIVTINDIFLREGTRPSKRSVAIYCDYKDHLMDYIIFIFKYYGYSFTIKTDEGKTEDIFQKYSDANGNISDANVEIIKDKYETQAIFACRLSKIYKIITKYIVGFYDLSEHSVREELAAKRIQLKTRHRKIFILSSKYQNYGFLFPEVAGQTPQQEAQEIEQSTLPKKVSTGSTGSQSTLPRNVSTGSTGSQSTLPRNVSTGSTGSTGSDFVFFPGFPGGNTQKRHKRKIRRTRKRRH